MGFNDKGKENYYLMGRTSPSNDSRCSVRIPGELKDPLKQTLMKINELREYNEKKPATFSSFLKHCLVLKLISIRDSDLGEGWEFLENFDLEKYLL